jgi:hypothetical protein
MNTTISVLLQMRTTLAIFKSLTNFILNEFNQMACCVILIIKPPVKSRNEFRFLVLFFRYKIGLIFKVLGLKVGFSI